MGLVAPELAGKGEPEGESTAVEPVVTANETKDEDASAQSSNGVNQETKPPLDLSAMTDEDLFEKLGLRLARADFWCKLPKTATRQDKLIERGLIFTSLGDYDKAIKAYLTALLSWDAKLPSLSSLSAALEGLADLYEKKEDFASALKFRHAEKLVYEMALIELDNRSKDHSSDVTTVGNAMQNKSRTEILDHLAKIFVEAGNVEMAADYALKASKMRMNKGEDPSKSMDESQVDVLAKICAEIGRSQYREVFEKVQQGQLDAEEEQSDKKRANEINEGDGSDTGFKESDDEFVDGDEDNDIDGDDGEQVEEGDKESPGPVDLELKDTPAPAGDMRPVSKGGLRKRTAANSSQPPSPKASTPAGSDRHPSLNWGWLVKLVFAGVGIFALGMFFIKKLAK